MSPFEVPEGPYTIEKVMEAIRVQVIEPTQAAATSASGNGDPVHDAKADTNASPTRAIISDGGPVSRLLGQLELLRQRQSLDPGYRIKSHRPLIGGALNLLKRLIHWGARPYADAIRIRQEAYNEAVLQAVREISLQFENNIHRLDDHQEYLRSFHKAIHDLQHTGGAHAQRMNEFDLRMQGLAGRLSEDAIRMDAQDHRMEAQDQRVEAQDQRQEALYARHDLSPLNQLAAGARRLENMDKTRGPYEDIRCRQFPYLQYFENVPGQVLDVGCGRGEMLHMLRIHGVECWGVEPDRLLAESCRENGEHVLCQDALTALQGVAPASLGGIFGAQVIEHFFPGDLVRFIGLARRKMARGGRVLFETLNPATLGVHAKSYWNDLDHKQMIHPEYLKGLLELAGFEEVEVHYLSPFDEEEKLPELPPAETLGLSEPARQALQAPLDRLNTLLFGKQDYFVVARQGEPMAEEVPEA